MGGGPTSCYSSFSKLFSSYFMNDYGYSFRKVWHAQLPPHPYLLSRTYPLLLPLFAQELESPAMASRGRKRETREREEMKGTAATRWGSVLARLWRTARATKSTLQENVVTTQSSFELHNEPNPFQASLDFVK